MKTSLFDFDLPESLIAAHPASPRDSARMLMVNKALHDRIIRELPQFLKPNDIMVFNDTRVLPARLLGTRGQGKVEVLLHKHISCHPVSRVTAAQDFIPSRKILRSNTTCLPQDDTGECWQCFAKPAKRLKINDRIDFADDFHAIVTAKLPTGEIILQFDSSGQNFRKKLERYGHMPLPPYIARDDNSADRECYQTIYAKHEGSVAAPTAGLHFTKELLAAIDAAGVSRAHVTLHVGGGTFLPVKTENTEDHVMHSEIVALTPEAADAINQARVRGGRVIAVGTTSLRTLESATDDQGNLHPFAGETAIFITPGYQFKIVDMLLTNFHLPRSTLFMLVSAFSGLEHMQAAYRHAMNAQYRFYSYGDACLLYRARDN